ncbi:MAG TPA: hypothetical protein VG944_11450 [Fimbriimonas sp.]|nr:hypothetical protein [Fimbriimonas sp.]
MKSNQFFVEQRPDGRYNVLTANTKRPRAVTATQEDGVEKARQLNPDAAIHVERVRDVGPGRDKWRKV